MERCGVCKKRLWPWTKIIVYNKKPVHRICWILAISIDRIKRIEDENNEWIEEMSKKHSKERIII